MVRIPPCPLVTDVILNEFVRPGAEKTNMAMQQMHNHMEEVKRGVVEVKGDVVEAKNEVQEVKCL